jgi:hypothetical protein
VLTADPRVAAFVAGLTKRWPDLSDEDDEPEEGSPWAANIDTSPAHVIVSISWGWAGEAKAAFGSMALRHGLYVFDPQASSLYGPSRPGDLEAFREPEGPQPGQGPYGPWKKRGGEALGEEVFSAVVMPRLGRLRPSKSGHWAGWAFDVSPEVEGRLWFQAELMRRRTYCYGVRVGIWHKGLADTARSLGVAKVPPMMAEIWAPGLEERLDADAIEEGAAAAMARDVLGAMGWARTITSLEDVVRELSTKRAALAPELPIIALEMLGRHEEALARAERYAAVALGFNWASNRKILIEKLAFVTRFLDRYDTRHSGEAALLVEGLRSAGVGAQSVSGLLGEGAGNNAAAEAIMEWLPRVGYYPLRRSLVVLLGEPWAMPLAATFLAEEFRRVASAEEGEQRSGLMTAIGLSFSRVATEDAAGAALAIAAERSYGTARAPFVEALGRLCPGSGEALGVLSGATHEADLLPFALKALGDLGLPEALPLVETFLDSPTAPVYLPAREARDKLVAQLSSGG